jgi:hypothetical protein
LAQYTIGKNPRIEFDQKSSAIVGLRAENSGVQQKVKETIHKSQRTFPALCWRLILAEIDRADWMASLEESLAISADSCRENPFCSIQRFQCIPINASERPTLNHGQGFQIKCGFQIRIVKFSPPSGLSTTNDFRRSLLIG